ncbi:MAG: Ldh family oxidoreductase [Alphaproteobacteria bacterium]|jgi:L-lactate dehydrogenase|nr:Ldh family oxidoreductase [Alphaproteobacteria bacterium]
MANSEALRRYGADDLTACTAQLFAAAGLDGPIAGVVAEILVEADLLGYDTHGLQFVPAYLADLEAGRTRRGGEPEILNDSGGSLLLDARLLPGQWVVVRALALARERISEHPVVSVAIRGSQNISCLATYVKRAADGGLMALLTTSSPGNAVVAPHGGRAPRLSTNPIAIGIPTDGAPILIDTSASATTNRRIERARRTSQRLPRAWLVDNAGHPTDDPEAIYTDPPGAILPAGGLDSGHKGFALALFVETLTSGLAGRGRAAAAHGKEGDGPALGSNVFLQLIDPAAFGGIEAFRHETGFLARICREAMPLAGGPAVRVPGDRAHARWMQQRQHGVALHPEIMQRMAPGLEKYGIDVPEPIA